MKTVLLTLAAALAIGAAAPAFAQTTPPRDTGNMAYPAPLPQGNVGGTTTTTPRSPTDTGNMAFPAPLPQGNVSTTTTTGPNRPVDTGSARAPAPTGGVTTPVK